MAPGSRQSARSGEPRKGHQNRGVRTFFRLVTASVESPEIEPTEVPARRLGVAVVPFETRVLTRSWPRIDTGIDYTHPFLGGKFGAGNKVAGAR